MPSAQVARLPQVRTWTLRRQTGNAAVRPPGQMARGMTRWLTRRGSSPAAKALCATMPPSWLPTGVVHLTVLLASDDVPGGVDVRDVGAELLVNDDLAAPEALLSSPAHPGSASNSVNWPPRTVRRGANSWPRLPPAHPFA